MTPSHPAVPTQAEVQAAKQAIADFQQCDDINRREYAADILLEHQATLAAALAHFAADGQKVEPVAYQVFQNGEWGPCRSDPRVIADWDERGLKRRPLYTRPDGLTLELARAVVSLSNAYEQEDQGRRSADLGRSCRKHAATIKMAEKMVKEERNAG